MKLTSSKFFGFSTALLLSVSPLLTPAFAQTATTDPVGFITLNVYGGSGASPKLSLVSPTLTQPVLWQGAVTAVGGAGAASTITVAGNPWAANQFNGAAGSHYVEIIATGTAARTGTLGDISGTATNTITTGPTGVLVGDSIKIRKDVTISDLLGATNSAGLLASDDASTADEVLVYNGASSVSYFYYNGGAPGFPNGWYNSTSFDPAGTVSIAPSEAVVIKRKAAGNLPVVFTGAVKTGNTLIPIQNGLNVLGTASAKGLTLATSGLFTGSAATGVKPSDDASTADEVTLYSPTAQTSFFYYNGGAPGFPNGWYNSTTFDPADATPIAPGTAFVLKRLAGNPAFNWVLPSPTSF